MINSRLEMLLGLWDEHMPDSFVLFAIAKEYEALGNSPAAISHYEKLRQIDPEYIGLYYHLAAIYAEEGKAEKALECYDEGIAIASRQGDQHAKSELMNARQNFLIS
ncbi:MAG: tetratricopeptide repeat protein [Saprospiraceae bacterium]|nr:tetratricopeptide repeat protein [Saprospiraceae bacterium]MBL0083091.1 tetratricopeptide repeat protein [Saprospiraceae bacterium]